MLPRSFAVGIAQAFASSDRLVLLGEPGSGKSTLLRYLAIVCAGGRTFARKHLDHARRWLPLCLPASELLNVDVKGGDFARLLAALFQSRVGASAASLAKAISEAGRAGRLCVLLDGLDEVSSPQQQTRIRDRIELLSTLLPPGCQMVVSSRVVGYPGLAFSGRGEYVLEPLSRDQARGLMTNFYTQVERARGLGEPEARKEAHDRGGALARALEERAGLGAFVSNPLLLTIAALVHLQIGRLPQYRVKLYDIAVHTLVEAWATARRAFGEARLAAAVDYEAEGRSVLTFLALHMQEHCAGGVIPEEALVDLIAKRLDARGKRRPDAAVSARAKDFLRRLQDAGAILTPRGQGQWGFMHRTFQEYLVAKRLVAEDRLDYLFGGNGRLFEAKWQEIVRLAAGELGIVQARDKALSQFIRRIQKPGVRDFRVTLLYKNVFLAAQALADTICEDRKLHEDVLNSLWRLWFKSTPWSAYKGGFRDTFQNLRGTQLAEDFTDRLVATLTNGDSPEKAWALVWLKPQRVFRDLAVAVDRASNEGKGAYLMHIAAQVAGPEDADALEAWWSRHRNLDSYDRYPQVAPDICKAIGRLGILRMVPSLLELARSHRPWLRVDLAAALAELRQADAAEEILGWALEGQSSAEAIAASLHRLAGEKFVEPTREALRTSDSALIRISAIYSLVGFQARSALAEIEEALEKGSTPDIRQAAAYALGKLGTAQAGKALMRAAQNVTEPATAAKAVEALARLRLRDAIPLLRTLLSEDTPESPRREAIEALGTLNDQDSVRPIRELLARSLREDSLIGIAATRALGRLRDRHAVPLLLKALKIRPNWLTENVGDSLVQILGSAAAPALIAALKRPRKRNFWFDGTPDLLWRLGEQPVAPSRSRQ